MVAPAPRIEAVLPTLLEFVGDAVIVGHNVRYDLGFLNAALERDRSPAPRQPRRSTPARWPAGSCATRCPTASSARWPTRFRLPHRPIHRALDDALATGDLLHVLLERAGCARRARASTTCSPCPRWPATPRRPSSSSPTACPASPGVYLFRDRGGRVLYVGKATDLRSRVRSYFSERRRGARSASCCARPRRIDHDRVRQRRSRPPCSRCASSTTSQPRFNRQAKVWSKYAYLKLTLNEPFPRLSVVRTAKDDGGLYLGPLSSAAVGRAGGRGDRDRACRCGAARPASGGRRRPGRAVRRGPARRGHCPCAGAITRGRLRRDRRSRPSRGLTADPHLLLDPLRERMDALAAAERFEEAADVRDRAAALAQALRRQRRLDALRRAGRVVLTLPDHAQVELDHGRLVASRPPPGRRRRPARRWPSTSTAPSAHRPRASLDVVSLFSARSGPAPPTTMPVPVPPAAGSPHGHRCCSIRSPATSPTSSPASPPWLDQHAPTLALVHSDGGLVVRPRHHRLVRPGARSAGAPPLTHRPRWRTTTDRDRQNGAPRGYRCRVMLEAILLAILLSVVVVMVLVGVLFGVFSWQLARSNRVVADAPTTAPILWLWSPTQPARLHRRLRSAVRPLPLPATGRRGRGDAAPARPAGRADADRGLPGRRRRPRARPGRRGSRDRSVAATCTRSRPRSSRSSACRCVSPTSTAPSPRRRPSAARTPPPRRRPRCSPTSAPASTASTRRTTSSSPSSATTACSTPTRSCAASPRRRPWRPTEVRRAAVPPPPPAGARRPAGPAPRRASST